MLDLTVGAVLDRAAARHPGNDAIVFPERGLRMNYRDFHASCERLAKGLIALGVEKEDRVAVWAYNVPEWVMMQFATAKAGAVLVTVNTLYKSHELSYVLRQSDSTALFIVSGYKDVNYVETTRAAVPEIPSSKPGALESRDYPLLKRVVFMGGPPPAGMMAFDDVMKMGDSVPDSALREREASLSQDDVINMQYTSGTTGFPKGVMLTHRNIVNNADLVGSNLGLTHADRYLIPVPFFHCFGCVLSTLNCVVRGATMVVIEQFDPGKALKAIHDERCTAINGVPTMFIAELEHEDFGKYDYSSLRTGIMAGATCPEETMRQVMERMHASEITICYGLTETSPVLTQTSRDDSVEHRVTTVGRPLPGTDVRVVEPGTDKELPPGEPGELVARGYCLMKGYYRMEEETARAIRDGWLHTKDLSVKTADGYFKILGRVDDMIIRGGENVYPREVEEFLYTHPAVMDAAVVGVQSKKFGEEVCAFVKLKEGSAATAEEIQGFGKARMARYKVPKFIFFVGSFPMTASGKIQKYKLRDMARVMLGLSEGEKLP